jgi:hypothetical protein
MHPADSNTINIDNFEEIFESNFQTNKTSASKKFNTNTKFILTSPRSLNACQNLNIKVRDVFVLVFVLF